MSKGCCSLVERAPAVQTSSQTTEDGPGLPATVSHLWTVMGPSFSSFHFLSSVMTFWYVLWTEEAGCLFLVTSGPPMLTPFLQSQRSNTLGLAYMCFEKGFIKTGQLLLLNQAFWYSRIRWDPRTIWQSPLSCKGMYPDVSSQSPQAVRSHRHSSTHTAAPTSRLGPRR